LLRDECIIVTLLDRAFSTAVEISEIVEFVREMTEFRFDLIRRGPLIFSKFDKWIERDVEIV
jgi:hypothetical protein